MMPRPTSQTHEKAYLYRFASQNEEGFGSLSQESGELVYQDILNLIGLFYPDANSHTVDARFYEDLLVLIAGNGQWVE